MSLGPGQYVVWPKCALCQTSRPPGALTKDFLGASTCTDLKWCVKAYDEGQARAAWVDVSGNSATGAAKTSAPRRAARAVGRKKPSAKSTKP
jgi:hypothetical protein